MNKKVLITGADGFIGSHLTEKLIISGYDVKAFCFYNSFSSYGWIDKLPSDVKKNIECILGDIRDFQVLKEAMQGCEQVFHLASLIAIPYSYKAPLSYIQTNINGTLNVLEAARDLEIKKIIHTSTSEVYGSARFIPINEDHPLQAQSPYAASKIGADQIALSFFKSFNTPVCILRPFNTYGPRQSCRAVIPSIITQIASGSKVINLGSLSPTRDFNFISDTCNAFIAVAESTKTIGEVINSASNHEISIGDTAKLISEVMNQNITIISDKKRIRPEKSEVDRLFGDNHKLCRLTGWKPQFSGLDGLRRGLSITAEWFSKKSNLELFNNQTYQI